MFLTRPIVRAAYLACLSLLMAACSTIGGGDVTTYDLTAPTEFSNLKGRTNAQILVQVPTALKSHDSEMIIVRPGGAELVYMGGVQWSDSLPNVLQDKLIQTLENSGRVRSVAKPGDGVVVDYKIATTIRAFELSDQLEPKAKVAVSIKIINDQSGRVRASKQFEASVPASLANPEKGVRALNRALNKVLDDILVWVLKTI